MDFGNFDEESMRNHDEYENELTDKYDICNFKKLYINDQLRLYGKIKALRDIGNAYCPVKKGETGGWILFDGKTRLSQDDESWIGKNSIVGDGCYISGDGTYIDGSILVGV